MIVEVIISATPWNFMIRNYIFIKNKDNHDIIL